MAQREIEIRIDERFNETGFVEVDDTRMLYAPAFVKEHRAPDPTDPIVTSETDWGPVTPAQHRAVIHALQTVYPNRRII